MKVQTNSHGREVGSRALCDEERFCFGFLLVALVSALTMSSCTNSTTSMGSGSSSSRSLPGLGGGVLPGTSGALPITLTNVGPSLSGTGSALLDLQGQDGEIALNCSTASDCSCLFEWNDPTSGARVGPVAQTLDYVEVNLARCRYDQVPANVSSFDVYLRSNNESIYSNRVTLNYPQIDSSKQTDNSGNYLKVIRYQCKDIVTRNTNFYRNNSLLDPQAWQMSLSFNFYTTSLGQDYGGAIQNFECPPNPTDEQVVQYSRDRYWPYAGPSSSLAVGPRGLDPRCGPSSSGAESCDCPWGDVDTVTTSTFNGHGTAASSCSSTSYTSAYWYDSRNPFFGIGTDSASRELATNGVIDGEPYDMTLWSTKPLVGADNVIYPTNIDEGAPSSYGIDNNKTATFPSGSSDCLDGSSSSFCKCVTGQEKECRKYTKNRHDFYLASFYDNTFKFPFCAVHTAGGSSGRNNIMTPTLDCSVDASRTPVTKGQDVLGFAALPDGSGSCPRVTLPKGKKWGLLWQFRASIQPRKMIDLANPGEIGQLMCTGPRYECESNSVNSLGLGNTAAFAHASIGTANAAGSINYCGNSEIATGGVADRDARYRSGPWEAPLSTRRGFRFGNCLDESADQTDQSLLYPTTWDATSLAALPYKLCRYQDGFTPFMVHGVKGAYNNLYAGGSLRLMNAPEGSLQAFNVLNLPTPSQGGCFDPALLYQQPVNYGLAAPFSSITGFFNFFTTGGSSPYLPGSTVLGCASWDDSSRPGALLNYLDSVGSVGPTPQSPHRIGFYHGGYFSTWDWQGYPFIAGNHSNSVSSSGVLSNETNPDVGVGFGGNICNPTLPGSRWTEQGDSSFHHNLSGNDQLSNAGATQNSPGWNDGYDVWLVSKDTGKACVEADVNLNGLLYNQYAHDFKWPYINRLPGPNVTTAGDANRFGFPGAVQDYPRTIKNWFDFVGIGCRGKCDNSDQANSYPSFPWLAGKFFNRGKAGTDTASTAIPDQAIRSGAHSSTDSWGGYGAFQFTTIDIDGSSRSDSLYIVSPEGISKDDMVNNDDLQSQYRPVRYINGMRIEYELVRDSTGSSTPAQRLPSFPMCILQDKSTPQDDL